MLPTTNRKDSYIYIYIYIYTHTHTERYIRVRRLHPIILGELADHDGGIKINKRYDEEHLHDPSW